MATHRVAPGQSTSSIAALHGIHVASLVAANPHRPTVVAYVGGRPARVFSALSVGEQLALPPGVGARPGSVVVANSMSQQDTVAQQVSQIAQSAATQAASAASQAAAQAAAAAAAAAVAAGQAAGQASAGSPSYGKSWHGASICPPGLLLDTVTGECVALGQRTFDRTPEIKPGAWYHAPCPPCPTCPACPAGYAVSPDGSECVPVPVLATQQETPSEESAAAAQQAIAQQATTEETTSSGSTT